MVKTAPRETICSDPATDYRVIKKRREPGENPLRIEGLSSVEGSIFLRSCLLRSWYRFHAALLGMQFRSFDVMVSRVLTVSMSKVCVMRCLFVFFGLIIFRCFVEMVSRFLMMTSGMMVMFPGL